MARKATGKNKILVVRKLPPVFVLTSSLKLVDGNGELHSFITFKS